ncbi:dual specificity protein phosphatase 18 [Polymixia lowei]
MNQSGTQRLSGLCQITDQLYLSSGRAASDASIVPRLKITCIIGVTENKTIHALPDVEYIHIPVVDSPASPLSDHFDRVADQIQFVGQHNGHTLVHCNAGVSRSATLCIAYLMKHRNMTLLDAHTWVKSRRPIVRPNVGFWKQLIRYESKLRGCTTVRMVSSCIGEIPDIYVEETKNMLPL